MWQTVAGGLDPDSRLFELAREGRRRSSAPGAVIVVFAVMVFGLIPGQIPARIVLFAPDGTRRFPDELHAAVEPIVMNVSMFLFMFIGMWLWLRLWCGRPFSTLGWERRGAMPRIMRGIVAALVMVVVVCGLSLAAGYSSAPGLLQKMGTAAFAIRLASLLAFFVQGPAEETLFRGWLMPVIGARHRPWVGVLVSSAVFSAAHALNSGVTMLGFVNLFLFGFCAALIALREGGLWAAGAWHGTWNWTMGDLLGFTLDGSPRVGLFKSVDVHGPAIISGGTFGPDGGLVCSAVLLTAIGVLGFRTGFSRTTLQE